MNRPVRIGATVASLLTALALAGPSNANPAPPPVFAQCAACHSVQPGKNGVGPSLAGVAGRKAGTAPGYAYSEALRASGLSWNAATLDRWLTGPRKLVPGTKMPFPGIPDAPRRKQVVAYLMTLRP